MVDDSYLIFNEKLEPYEQYRGVREVLGELPMVCMVAGSCQFGWGVGGYLARNITGRLILGAFASGAKYTISDKFFDYVKNNKEIRNYLDYLQNKLIYKERKK
jgi:hypothetical protein